MPPVPVIAKRYLVYLNAECRRRHYHRRIGKWVMEFSIQLEILFRTRWLPIIRYDTAHGFVHKDILSPNGQAKKFTLDNIQTFEEAMTFAENDIKSNWELYREQFLKEVSNDG